MSSRREGIMGLWAGYSAALVLTLNPSMAFYLQNVLGELLVDGSREGASGDATFLVAAVSRVIATVMTYPFRRAKAISQVSAPESTKSELAVEDVEEPESKVKVLSRRLHRLTEESISVKVYKMDRTEGIPALYEGRRGELLQAVLNHGTAMLSKEIVRKLVVQLYSLIPRIHPEVTDCAGFASAEVERGYAQTQQGSDCWQICPDQGRNSSEFVGSNPEIDCDEVVEYSAKH